VGDWPCDGVRERVPVDLGLQASRRAGVDKGELATPDNPDRENWSLAEPQQGALFGGDKGQSFDCSCFGLRCDCERSERDVSKAR
jgi:hypothetical protein